MKKKKRKERRTIVAVSSQIFNLDFLESLVCSVLSLSLQWCQKSQKRVSQGRNRARILFPADQEVGISGVRIDAQEELARPIYYRKMLGPFFASVKRIAVEGAEKLVFLD
ncbi:3-methyl-2-oxobutanoate hydroxymethyltransferase [Striga asiatica]|uniref:3-methyl-2-oxobutanoate hydroxymethyltransferase n=1 Tax=Striga asiatica TaxID=4170 RepID=A0A5A7PMG3_STRAF|nr:3-methyl-2-oxobutanoate hydroxymethyltransferase [Striga asiatica]